MVLNRSKANLGMPFEDMILAACQYYKTIGVAAIIKVPTPFKIQRRYDPKLQKSVIAGCYPEEKAYVDFLGQFHSQPVAFEAKSTQNKTSFPLKNIADHQLEHLRFVHNLMGAAFILIYCEHIGKFYRLSYPMLEQFQQRESRKSIPFTWLAENALELSFNRKGVLAFLYDL